MPRKKIHGEPKTASNYAQRLLRLRARLELSQRDLAKEFGVSPGSISLWEQGKNPIPGPVRRLIELYEERGPKQLKCN